MGITQGVDIHIDKPIRPDLYSLGTFILGNLVRVRLEGSGQVPRFMGVAEVCWQRWAVKWDR
jgi:hypothetical protein